MAPLRPIQIGNITIADPVILAPMTGVSDLPFRKLDNVVLTPHLGYVSQQNYERYYPDIVESIRGFLDGKPVRVIMPK